MSARLRGMSDDELGAAIAGLDIAWPPAPDLAPEVMASVRRTPAPTVRPPISRTARALLVAAAAALLLAGAAVAARILLDLGAVVVEVTPRPGGGLPSPTAVPFGEPIALGDAEDLLGDEIPLPSALGRPDRIWGDRVLTDGGEVVRITVAWEPRPGLPAIEGTELGAVLIRFEGRADQAFKDLFEGTGSFAPAVVHGREAVWTTGPHVLEILTGEGVVFVRVEGNVLLWSDGRYTLRLETAAPKTEALRIARSVPAGTS